MCKLQCINEQKVFMELARVAKDGTSCKAGTNNMCISGMCRVMQSIFKNFFKIDYTEKCYLVHI